MSTRTTAPPPPPPPPPAWSGYAPAPAAALPAPVVPARSHRKVLVRLIAGVGAAVAALIVVALIAAPSKKESCDPPYCGVQPPTAPPVAGDHTFTSSKYKFTMTWFDVENANQQVQTSDSELDVSLGSDGSHQLAFFASPAKGDGAQNIVEDFVSARFPGAEVAYPLPNPMVGYRPGYGAVYDIYPQSTNGSASHQRIAVVSAVKGDLAVTAVALGPFTQFSGSDPNGHPSAVDFVAALFLDDPMNTIRWPGDDPR